MMSSCAGQCRTGRRKTPSQRNDANGSPPPRFGTCDQLGVDELVQPGASAEHECGPNTESRISADRVDGQRESIASLIALAGPRRYRAVRQHARRTRDLVRCLQRDTGRRFRAHAEERRRSLTRMTEASRSNPAIVRSVLRSNEFCDVRESEADRVADSNMRDLVVRRSIQWTRWSDIPSIVEEM